jgi:hypothetical protein
LTNCLIFGVQLNADFREGTSVDDFRDGKGEVVVWPEQYKAGEAVLPYTEAKK